MNTETHNCVALWSCVMLQAISDACDRRGPDVVHVNTAAPDRAPVQREYIRTTRALNRSAAMAWLMRDDHDVAGFLWVCDVVGLEPDVVRARLGSLDGMTIRTLKRNKPLRVHNHGGDESCLGSSSPQESGDCPSA
jgi:hypothetical protein